MVLRVTASFLCMLLAAFAAVQYNDPDVYFWMPAYSVGAVWCGITAVRPRLLSQPATKALLALTIALAVIGSLYFWPTEIGFWRKDVWQESEAAREGMGMIVLTVCLLVPAFGARTRG